MGALLAFDCVTKELADLVFRLQALTTLLGQKKAQFEAHIVTLEELCNVVGPKDNVSLATIGQFVIVVRGSYFANIGDACVYLQDLGSFPPEALHTLDAKEVVSVKRSNVGLSAGLVAGLSRIDALPNKTHESNSSHVGYLRHM